ncbi:MAG: two-component regulator propeller domain-containing protein, partial [Saprospiraceae bacterium]
KGFVFPIIEDKDKTIWVGTVLGGLCRYNRETDDFTRYINNPADPFSISDDFIKCILEDEEGFLWIGTQKGALNKFDKLTGKFYHFKFECGDNNIPSESGIVKLYLDSKKNLWISDRGLILFNRKSEKCIRFVNDINNSNSISSNDPGSIYEDDNGILWIATNGGGLNKFDPSTGTFKHYRHVDANPESSGIDYIYDICKDDFGMIWIASLKHTGQGIFDPLKEEFFVYGYNSLNDHSINKDGVLQLYKDTSGTIWLSTVGSGVYYYNENKWRFEHYVSDTANPDSLSSNDIGAMCEDKQGNLWISTTKGLNVFSKENKKINDHYGNPDFFNSLKADENLSLCCDAEGRVWIGHGEEGLLDMYDYETNEFKRFNHNLNLSITCLYEDSDGLLWVVYLKYGLKVFNKERTEWKTYDFKAGDISFHTVYSIMEDNESNIWFGTYYDGIHILNKKTGKFTTLVNDPKDKNSLNTATIIFPLYQDRKGFIWIGTHGHGLDKFDPKQNKFTHYTERQGLANNYIQG